MKAVIYRPATKNNWWPLPVNAENIALPILNKTLLHFQIEHLYRAGIRDIALLSEASAADVASTYGSGECWGVNLVSINSSNRQELMNFLQDQENALSENVFWLPGNLLSDGEIADLHIAHCSRKNDFTRISEAVATVASAIINTNTLIEYLKENGDFAALSMQQLPENISGKTATITAISTAVEINSLVSYEEAQKKILYGEFKYFLIPGWQISNNCWIGVKSKVHPSVLLEGPVFIGDNTHIHADCYLGSNTIIGDRVIIDDLTTISDSTIFHNTYIGSSLVLRKAFACENHLYNKVRNTHTIIDEPLWLKKNFGASNLNSRFGNLSNRINVMSR